MADGCHFGWGSFITITACFITAFAGQCGRAVKPKTDIHQEWCIDYLERQRVCGFTRARLAKYTSLVDTKAHLDKVRADPEADLEAPAQQPSVPDGKDARAPAPVARPIRLLSFSSV